MTFEQLVPSTSAGTLGLPGASVVKGWKIDGVQNWRELIENGATTTTTVDAYGLPQFETPANVAKAVTESDVGVTGHPT